jgi:hypothetical protein
MVNSAHFNTIKFVRVCHFCSQEYKEFHNEILQTCRIHHGLHPNFFSNFIKTYKYDIGIFKIKGYMLLGLCVSTLLIVGVLFF